jgi:hypothetical protein
MLNCPKGHNDVLALWWSPRGCTATEIMQIHVRALMHVLDPNLEASSCPGDGLNLHGFTSFHVIDQAITCFLIYNRNLFCGEGTSLDYCDVISTTSDHNMANIVLGRLYVVLSYRLPPTDSLPV